MKKFLLFLLLITIGVYSCKKDKQPEPKEELGSMHGTVKPINSVANIVATATIGGQSYTFNAVVDAEGKYGFYDFPVGSYTINYTPSPGYTAPPSKTVNIVADKDTDIGEVTLQVASTGGSISGVLNPVGIVTAMRVVYTLPSGGSTSTYANVTYGADGSFKLDNLPAGSYTIGFNDVPGYITPSSKTVTVVVGQNVSIGTFTFAQAQLGSISGTVGPIGAGATVEVARLNYIFSAPYPIAKFPAVLDANGKFKVSDLAGGYNYSVTVTKANGSTLNAPYPVSFYLFSGQNVDVGNLDLTTAPPPFPMSWTAASVVLNATLVRGTYSGTKLTLSTSANVTNGGRAMEIIVDGVNSAGVYNCNSSTTSSMKYSMTMTSIDITRTYTSSATGASGVVTITKFDLIHQNVSGTFTGKLAYGTSLIDITNGTFNDVRFGKQ